MSKLIPRWAWKLATQACTPMAVIKGSGTAGSYEVPIEGSELGNRIYQVARVIAVHDSGVNPTSLLTGLTDVERINLLIDWLGDLSAEEQGTLLQGICGLRCRHNQVTWCSGCASRED